MGSSILFLFGFIVFQCLHVFFIGIFFSGFFFGTLSGKYFSLKIAPIEPTGVQNGAKMPPKTAPEGAQDAIL